MQRMFSFLAIVFITACGTDQNAADECCPELGGFDEERTYRGENGEQIYFHGNGSLDWQPLEGPLTRGRYRVCGTRVWVDVTAATDAIQECMLVSQDGETLGSREVRYDRSN